MPVQNPRHSRFFWRSTALFCILDTERHFKEVNTAWEKTLGLTTARLLAKSFFEYIHPDDQPPARYFLDQLKQGLPSVSFSCRFQHHDGNYRSILWEINNAASSEYAYYGVGMDVTAREQPMIADEILSVIPEGIVLQYANGTIGASNPSAERILGLPAEQMMGWTLVDPDWKLIHQDGSLFPAETHPAICTLRTGQAYSDVIIGVQKPDETIWIRVNSYPLWRDDVTTPYAVVISFSDITLLKNMEVIQPQKRSEDTPPSLTATQDFNYDIWEWNLETNQVNFSKQWKQMLGFQEAELVSHPDSWLLRIHPADYKRVMADIQNHLQGVTPALDNVHRVQYRDGNYRWIRVHAVTVRDTQGSPLRLIGTHVDVTEARRVEDELQELEKKYRQLLDTESDALFIIDADTTEIIDANRAASAVYGYSREQLLRTKQIELAAQPDRTVKSLKRGMKATSEQFQKRQDGSVFPAEVTASPFIWKGRQVLLVIVREITERQRIETALWESEAKYRQLFEAASQPTVVFDANTQQFFDVNRAAMELYGYTKEEWLQMTTEDVSAEPNRKRASFATSNKKGQVIPLRWHRKRDGTVFPVEISTGNSYLFQGRSLICATLRDISERKAAEEALRTEKDFISTLVQASPTFFVALNPDRRVRMMNRAMLTAIEYSLEEIVNMDYLTTCVPEAERSILAAELEMLAKSMQPSLVESHIISKTGKVLLVEWHSRAIVKPNGTLDYFFGVGIDVTERKKAQGHLRLFKSIVESSEEAIIISNAEGIVVYVNAAYQRLFERPAQQVRNLILRDHYPPAAQEIWDKQIVVALQQGNSWQGELTAISSKNHEFPIWQRIDAVRDANGRILFWFNLMHDISERQRMWETLRKQWEENQMIFHTIPAMIWYRDHKNQLVRTNRLAQDSLVSSDAQRLTDCREVIETDKAQSGITYAYQNMRGENRWLQMDKIPYHDTQGNLIGVIVFAMDMTDYKRVQTNEERMGIVVEHIPFLLVALDEENKVLVWNRTCEDVTHFSRGEMIGNAKTMEWLYPDVQDREQMLSQLENYETSRNIWENQVTCRDGVNRIVEWYCVAKQFPIAGWHTWFIGQDVTRRRQTERTFQEEQSLLGLVFHHARIGISLTDDRGKFLQVNRAFASFYGFNPDELVGQPFTVVLPAATHGEAVREYYSLLMTHEEPSLLRRRREQRRDGKSMETQLLATRVILEDKRRLLISIISKLEELRRID